MTDRKKKDDDADEDTSHLFTILDTDYFRIEDCYIPMTEKWEIGTCVCCGGTTKIYRGANIIYIFCDDDKKCNIECSRRSECLGTDYCVNKDKFSKIFSHRITKKITGLLADMIDWYDVVLISSTPESRKVVAKKYFCNVYLTTTQAAYKDVWLIKIIVDRKKYEKQKEKRWENALKAEEKGITKLEDYLKSGE